MTDYEALRVDQTGREIKDVGCTGRTPGSLEEAGRRDKGLRLSTSGPNGRRDEGLKKRSQEKLREGWKKR